MQGYTIGHKDLVREKKRLMRLQRRGVLPPAENDDSDLPTRPRTREHCDNVPRPCPFASCKHNLLLDVNKTGGIRISREHFNPGQPSCALDMAERGGMSLKAVGAAMNMEGEAARIILVDALRKLKTEKALEDFYSQPASVDAPAASPVFLVEA